jgi:VCBS repeat protein
LEFFISRSFPDEATADWADGQALPGDRDLKCYNPRRFMHMQRAISPHVLAILVLVFGAWVPGRAQIGVATGNGVATPARPLPPGMKPPVVNYQDVAAKAGLTAINVSGAEKNKQFIVETTGNGVAIFDYDNDGLPDILLVNGDRFQKDGSPSGPVLYHNLGGLRFEDVTRKAGLVHTGWGQGVCAGDIDNDGLVDVFITAWGENVLYHNMGNGTFRNETAERGLASTGKRWSTGCAFFDFTTCWWCITSTSTPRARPIPASARSANGRDCR